MASSHSTTIIIFLACFCVTSAHAKDGAHAKLSAFVATGEALYKRAITIIDQNPTTESEVIRIFVTTANQWLADEHKFQKSFFGMQGISDLPDNVREGIIRVEQFDNFVFDAVTATNFCDNTSAHWKLKIAGQILERAKMASKGHPDPEWNPDLDSEPESHGGCKGF